MNLSKTHLHYQKRTGCGESDNVRKLLETFDRTNADFAAISRFHAKSARFQRAVVTPYLSMLRFDLLLKLRVVASRQVDSPIDKDDVALISKKFGKSAPSRRHACMDLCAELMGEDGCCFLLRKVVETNS